MTEEERKELEDMTKISPLAWAGIVLLGIVALPFVILSFAIRGDRKLYSRCCGTHGLQRATERQYGRTDDYTSTPMTDDEIYNYNKDTGYKKGKTK